MMPGMPPRISILVQRSSRKTRGETRRMARFGPGNQAAVGNRGGGRPPKLLRELTTGDAAKVWRELKAIAFKPEHPLHARFGFHALRTMAQLAFPRPTPAPPDDGLYPSFTLLDLLRRDDDLAPTQSPSPTSVPEDGG